MFPNGCCAQIQICASLFNHLLILLNTTKKAWFSSVEHPMHRCAKHICSKPSCPEVHVFAHFTYIHPHSRLKCSASRFFIMDFYKVVCDIYWLSSCSAQRIFHFLTVMLVFWTALFQQESSIFGMFMRGNSRHLLLYRFLRHAEHIFRVSVVDHVSHPRFITSI